MESSLQDKEAVAAHYLGINSSWKDAAASWRSTFRKQLQAGEEKLAVAATEKRDRKKDPTAKRPASDQTHNVTWVTQSTSQELTTRGAAQVT